MVAAIFLSDEDVNTTTISRYPDVAIAVFDGLIGAVRGERPQVVFVVVEIGDGIAATTVGRHLIDSLVFVAQPVVALGIAADAIETSERLSLAVVGQRLAVAVFVNEEQGALLVANK